MRLNGRPDGRVEGHFLVFVLPRGSSRTRSAPNIGIVHDVVEYREDVVDSNESVDRRSAPRRSLRAAVVVRRLTPFGPAPEAHGETVDMSFGGFGARLDGEFATGDVVDADLVLGHNVVTLRALVVGTSPDGDHQRVHCAFSTPPVPVQEAIAEFLASASAAQ